MRQMKTLPNFVNEVLQEWDFVAFFAYDGFATSGRGVVGLTRGDEGTQVMYGPRAYFEKLGDTKVLGMLDVYDPETEFLVHFDALEGSRTVRVRTPENGRHPKRVWFFEMLRRASEDPDELPEHLPEWFIDAIDALCRARKDEAESGSRGF